MMADAMHPPIPSLYPYKVEQQPGGQWACVMPNLGVIPEATYPTPGEAIACARRALRYDSE